MNSSRHLFSLFSILLFAALGGSAPALRISAAEAIPHTNHNTVVAAPSPEASLTFRAALSHSAYTQSAPTQLLFKVDFRAPDKRPAERPPLNLALVLDRSGSMADEMKFPHAIAAARAVIENLTERDTSSLVAFNDRSLVLSPAGRAVNKPFLFQRLAEVAPEGITDLSAGLLEGMAQVNSQSATGQVKHVILLTDGEANAGITDPVALRKIVENAKAKGVGLSTLGCGADFNQTLLTDLALAGGGRYTFVKSSEQLPAAFRQELHGLLEVVAQNVRLEIALNGGTIRKVYGQPWQGAGGASQIQIGNLRAGERGSVMVALKPADFKPGSALEVNARLTYDSAETSERLVRTETARAVFAASGSGVKVEENEGVALCGAAMDAMDSAMTALESFDADRYAQARASFDKWHGRVRKYALAHRNQDLLNEAFLLKHFMDELEAIRSPGARIFSGETQSKIQKQADYQGYQSLHHEVMQAK